MIKKKKNCSLLGKLSHIKKKKIELRLNEHIITVKDQVRFLPCFLASKFFSRFELSFV